MSEGEQMVLLLKAAVCMGVLPAALAGAWITSEHSRMGNAWDAALFGSITVALMAFAAIVLCG